MMIIILKKAAVSHIQKDKIRQEAEHAEHSEQLSVSFLHRQGYDFSKGQNKERIEIVCRSGNQIGTAKGSQNHDHGADQRQIDKQDRKSTRLNSSH